MCFIKSSSNCYLSSYPSGVKKYGQQCPLARALDVIGERWSLLVVRELLLGPRRYTDLLDGLPGIPTNLLASRLKGLQAAGIVARRALPRPAAIAVYELTEIGRALRPALAELRAWGQRYGPEPDEGDAIQPAWVLLSGSGRPTGLPAGRTVELRIDTESFQLSTEGSLLTVTGGPAPVPDATITMSAETLYRLMTGETTVAPTLRQATVDGDPDTARLAIDTLHGGLTETPEVIAIPDETPASAPDQTRVPRRIKDESAMT
jgi:DNA-binding HxlR family transcriptional regulator